MEKDIGMEKDIKMDERLLRNLSDAGHVIHRLSNGRCGQKKILILLNSIGTITQRELTEKLRVQSASSSEILMKMEQAGWIIRTPGAEDRRTMDISLTEAGRREAEAAAGRMGTLPQELFLCLTVEEKRSLLAVLEKLNEDWDGRYRGGIRCREKEAGKESGGERIP